MAEFATEYDKLMADPTFQIVVGNITGIPRGQVVGVVIDDLSIEGGNSFHNMLESSGVKNLQENIMRLQSIAEKAAYFSKIKDTISEFSVRTVEQGMDFWTGSKRPTFRQSMFFLAQKATDDVRIPVSHLYKTVFPTLKGFGFTDTVMPPLGYVPYSASDVKDVKGTIDVSIGRWFRGTGFVMDSVNFKFSKETTSAGNPLFAAGQIEFHPFREISWQEVCAYMGLTVQ